jgi:hypothetical protein
MARMPRTARAGSIGPVSLALLAAGLAGCGGSDADQTFTVRDSAGVVIAENLAAVPAPGAFALSPEPVVQIGAVDGDDAYLFARVRGGVRLSDGRIAVLDDRAAEVRIFDADGRHVRTLGRKGEGPGEFDTASFLGRLPGDTLVVVDTPRRRINFFHPDDGFIRAVTARDDDAGYLLVAGMFGDGTLVEFNTVFNADAPEGYARRPVEYRTVGRDGAGVAELGTYPGYESVLAMVSEGDQTFAMTGQAPFGKQPAVAVGGERFFFGSQDTWEIRVLRMDGSLERLIRWDRTPEPVTEAQVADFVDRVVSRMEDNNLARRYRRFYADAPAPETHPAYGDLFVDRLGWLWVQEYRVDPEAPDHWTVLDPDGRVAGAAELPADFRLLDIGRDYVLGRWVDDLGVSYVRLYRLTRPE